MAIVEDEAEAAGVELRVSVGDPMPSVGLRASDGFLLNLRSFVGKGPSVFYFFAGPTDAGARGRRGTRIAEALARGARRLAAAGVQTVGVTCDNERQQLAWIEERSYPFLLFSDERRSAVDRLGIPMVDEGGNRNVARPVAVIVGTDGLIDAILLDPEPEFVVDIVVAAVRRGAGTDEDEGPAERTAGA